MAEIALEVNGEEIRAPKGNTILEACEKNDIHIPTICHYENLLDVGVCRMCLVEVDGELQSACTTPAQDGMKVKTDTERLWNHRRMVLKILFAETNHYCMYCDKEGECELEEMFKKAGIDSVELSLGYEEKKVDGSNENILVDRNRCILCGRCVRTCEEIVANDTAKFGYRGEEATLIFDNDVPLKDSFCISCGACVQACPTGALLNKQSLYKGTLDECEITESTCCFCSEGCGINVLTHSGSLVRIEGSKIKEAPRGQLCRRGRFKPLEEGRERIEEAFMKEGGELKKADLEKAIKRASKTLSKADSINAICSNRLPTETIKQFKEVMRGFGARFSLSGAQENRILKEFPEELIVNSTTDVMDAKSIVVYDTSIFDSHSILSSYVRRASKGGTKLITVDSQEDLFHRYSDIWINIELETLPELNETIFKIIEENLVSVPEIPKLGKINTGKIMKASSYLKKDNTIAIVGPKITDKRSLDSLSDLFSLVGGRILFLNPFSNQAFRGLATESLRSADLAYIFASDYGGEHVKEMIKTAKNANFVIVQASRRSKLTEIADIVLPALDWFERRGTFVDVNGKEKEINQIVEPRAPLTDREVLRMLQS